MMEPVGSDKVEGSPVPPASQCPYKLASREFHPEDTVVRIKDVAIGLRGKPILVAGPCAVESEAQLMAIAEGVARAGARILRGGAFKPRTSPYSFQGLGEDGLKLLSKAARKYGLLVVTEVMDWESASLVCKYADILQIGSRNMANVSLLKKIGGLGKPVLLKRGMSAKLEELVCAAEYLLVNGTRDVILCERGIVGFDPSTRNTLDLAAVAVLKRMTHLPVIVDPSHACGRSDIIVPMSRAAVVAGADGLLVEVAVEPDNALCDGRQSILPEQLERIQREITLLQPFLEAMAADLAG